MALKFPLFIFLVVTLSLPKVLLAQSDSTTDPAVDYVLSITNKVEKENKLAGNMDPDSVSSLPIGIVKEIGVTRYIIAIDSASFKPTGAFFNAYMALDFPGSDKKIAFEARMESKVASILAAEKNFHLFFLEGPK